MRRRIISLTPLIDVVFILLVFFMLASSFLDWHPIDVDVTKAGRGGGATGALLVDVRPDGLRLSGLSIEPAAFDRELRTRFSDDPDRHVLIKAADGVPLQDAVDALERVTRAGGRKVSFMTAPEG